MFPNSSSASWTGPGSIADKIKRLPAGEIDALPETEAILRDALNSLTVRLADLPDRDRCAALSLLYKTVSNTVFDFHLSILASAARENIEKAATQPAKEAVLREFRATAADLESLHGR